MHMHYRILLVLGVEVLHLLSCNVTAGQTTSSQRVVSGLRDTFARVLDVDMRGTSLVFAKGWNLRSETKIVDSAFRIASSSDYWSISTRVNSRSFVNGKFVRYNGRLDYILGPEGAVISEWNDGNVDSVVLYQHGKSHEDELNKPYGLGHLGTISQVFGFVDGHESWYIPDLLVDSTAEQIPDSDVVVLRTDGDFGTWEARIDAVAFVPIEISIVCNGNDYAGTKRLMDYKPTGDSRQLYPNQQLICVNHRLRFSSSTLDNGEKVIVGVTNHQRFEYAGGVVFELRNVVTIDHIALERQSDDKFLFARLEIPDNTPVQLAHAPQLPYVWKAGKAVKGLPHRDDHELPLPFRRRSSSRFAWVFGSVTVIAVVLGTIWWRRKLTSA